MSNTPTDQRVREVAPATTSSATERLAQFAAAVRRRWLPAVLVLTLTVVGTAALTKAQHKTYDATAQILLQPTDAVQSTISPGSVSSQADAERDVNTYTQMITVEPVANAVRRQLALKTTLPQLLARIQVAGAETSNLVSITAQDANAGRAAQLATAFATQYQSYRRETALQQINQALAAAQANPQAKVAGSAVAQRVRQLQAAAASETGGVQIVRPATIPASPSSPSLRSRILLGTVVGLILALAAVLGLEAVDRRLLALDQFEVAFNAPVLAAIPPARRSLDPSGQQAMRRRAYTDLAARLAFTDVARNSRAIMISPASASESAGAVALGLAEALGTLGRRVMLIEADLGARPSLRAGEPDEPGGLTSVLTGRSSFSREVTEVHFMADSASGRQGPQPWGVVSYSTLPSGPRVSEPEALLGRPTMQDVLTQARARDDLVLVLTAPLDQPSGVLPLARLCDGVIVLARERSIKLQQAHAIVGLLDTTGARLLGTVLLPADRSEKGAAAGGHGFPGFASRDARQSPNGDARSLHPLAAAGTNDE